MNTKYITITDDIVNTERMCSQLFTYFVLYSVTKKTGHSLAISSASDKRYSNLVYDCFDTSFPLFPKDINFETYKSEFCSTEILDKNLLQLDINKNFIIESRFDYPYIYIKDILHELPGVFKFRQHILKEAQNIVKDIKEPIASLHFRRTDYPFYMDMFMEYYKQALAKMPNNTHLLLLSDDNNWLNNSNEINELIKNKNYTKSNLSGNVDLCLMTLCDYNVCCPSSYSLVGSILNSKQHVTYFPDLANTPIFHHVRHIQKYVQEAHNDWTLLPCN